ncbi:phosphatidylinositol mannoside acyltransferase [Calidifontibacter sp. DB0510]|uniref:Phosphatidylinositol mannoside acyltransferase n=1 Tax=Metallococcus carri TaxID=1656884 RepID=A0A967B8W2_9MICO|nr:phosphatidylinositol mannoside acyltransferase [Metallococcus carri]NHN56966.1 phosphatidylinositol mannoside acyltransferase [Metallococcus carri]NOP37711.1 phosphatidylinositol mannoside acyltransferase [Calidifontibacter sp. DB2511S]
MISTDRLEVLGYRAAWSLVRRLPERTAYRLFDAAAKATYRRDGRSVQRMRENYRRIRPELDAAALEDLVAAGVRSYLRYWCDAFRLSVHTPEQLDERIRLTGADAEARAIVARGEPLILFLGHLGNWDLAGAWATTHFAPVTTVAERLEPEEVFTEFLTFRESLGMTIVPLTGGVDPYPTLRAALGRGAFVPLLADRDLTSHGVEVTLCGQQIKAATGPARLALDTGAALFPLAITYEDVPGRAAPRVVAHFGDRVVVPDGDRAEQVRAMTQACVDGLGERIRTHTQDWHMMQRIFSEDL